MIEIHVDITDRRRLRALRSRLEKPTLILKEVGTTILRGAQRSFDEQRGPTTGPWPELYGGTSRVNIAGALSDLNRGATVKSSRLDTRGVPALLDTNRLYKSLAPSPAKVRMVGPTTARTGTDVEYGALQHFGGVNTQPVTETAKRSLGNQLKRARNKHRRERRRGPVPFEVVQRKESLEQLAFLFHEDEIHTEVVPREFLGVDEKTAREITERTEELLSQTGLRRDPRPKRERSMFSKFLKSWDKLLSRFMKRFF